MAGDWMKIDLELSDKPEVHGIAGMIGIDSDAVVGKLIRVWQWFDKHTTDGNAHGVTFALVDRLTGVTGFGEAMMFVGWLEQHDKTLHMPKFDRHTSKSAKTRALTGKRQEIHRDKSNAKSNGVSVTKSLPEKRREEKSKGTRLTAEFQMPQDWITWAIRERTDLSDSGILRESEKFKDYWTARAGSGGLKLDWLATWRNWIRESKTNSAPAAPATTAQRSWI